MYPIGVKRVKHPELEGEGPAEYDLVEVERWFHICQIRGKTNGQTVYNHLRMANELSLHLGLADLLAIKAMGVKVFRRFFHGQAIFGWRSVVEDHDGNLLAPFLVEHRGEVALHWCFLSYDLTARNPGLRFSN